MISDISPRPAGTNHGVIGGQMTKRHENKPVPVSKCIDKCVCAFNAGLDITSIENENERFYSEYGIH